MEDELFRDLLEDSAAERGPIFNTDDADEVGRRSALLKYYAEEVFETEPTNNDKEKKEKEDEDTLAPGEFKLLSECSYPHIHYVCETDNNNSSGGVTPLSSSTSTPDGTDAPPKNIFSEFGKRTQAGAMRPRVRQCWYSFPNDVNSKGEATLKHTETLAERINRLQLEAAQLEEDLKREVILNGKANTKKEDGVGDSSTKKNACLDEKVTRELRAQSTCLEAIRDIDRRVARIEGFLGPSNYESRNESMSAIKGLSECAKRLRGLNAMLEQAAATGEEDEVSRSISVTTDVVKGFEENNGLSSEYAKHVAALYDNLQRWEATVEALPEVFKKFKGVVKLNLSRIDVASFDADLTKIENTQKEIEAEIKENSALLARISVLVAQNQKEIDESLSALEKKVFGN